MDNQTLCALQSPVCPDCFAQPLSPAGDRARVRCPACAGEWPAKSRRPCPELVLAKLTHPAGDGPWMCPSHLCLAYNKKSLKAVAHDGRPTTDRSRAIHEAGHVVVARWFGFGIASVRITPDPDDQHPGAARIDWGEPPPDPAKRQEWAEHIARVCFAGLAATQLYCEDTPSETEAVSDLTLAAFVLTRHAEGGRRRLRRDRLLDEARRSVKELLTALGEQCIDLANALETRGRLERADIVTMLDPRLPNRPHA